MLQESTISMISAVGVINIELLRFGVVVVVVLA